MKLGLGKTRCPSRNSEQALAERCEKDRASSETWSVSDRCLFSLVQNSWHILGFRLLPLNRTEKKVGNLQQGSPLTHTAVTKLLAGGQVFDSRNRKRLISSSQSPHRF
jgi:hypothetical protein